MIFFFTPKVTSLASWSCWGGWCLLAVYIFCILNSFCYLLLPELISPRDTNTLLEAEWGQKENSFMWFKSTFMSVCQSLPGSLPYPEGEELPLELSCFQQERQSLFIPFPHQIDFQFIGHQRWAVWRQLYQPCCAQNFGNQNSFFQLLMLNNVSEIQIYSKSCGNSNFEWKLKSFIVMILLCFCLGLGNA